MARINATSESRSQEGAVCFPRIPAAYVLTCSVKTLKFWHKIIGMVVFGLGLLFESHNDIVD